MAERRVAIVPGSFDPITRGHVDVVARAVRLFDEVVVGVLVNPGKASLLDGDSRVRAAAAALAGYPTVRVARFDGLLVEFARAHAAAAVVRGLRTGTDFEYEWPMARMNRAMAPALDTVFLAASPEWAHVSASLVRDIHRLGGDVSPFVPPNVLARLRQRFSKPA